ncbi:MAG: cupin domain-containing protein [Clostridium sp.]|uniref:cupin domain-containing protein n=1 Tax=Clostridium sp. TaxID=1506 RepID=UPI001EBAB6EB|nr:cupin domain-containing protein [Clostridium sp.]MBS5884426.1 cupin domain-containing protein [Clostridium sp.]MDU7147744.1 cupin domain-containing protein [Clostridium sp.]MDU7241635.1 cupin domain-containing protein [Clostridium sp.]
MDINKQLLNGTIEQYNDMVVPKIPVFSGNDLISEVYFFEPGQVLKTHRHPNGEQIFIFLKGEGKIKVGENEFDVSIGSTVFIHAGEWHEITNGNKQKMTVAQVTKVNAGVEYK